MGNCPTLLKKVCYMQYNLPHPPLKVTMAFEWNCGVPSCQNPFPSPLCVCVFVSQKKKTRFNNFYNIFILTYCEFQYIFYYHFILFQFDLQGKCFKILVSPIGSDLLQKQVRPSPKASKQKKGSQTLTNRVIFFIIKVFIKPKYQPMNKIIFFIK